MIKKIIFILAIMPHLINGQESKIIDSLIIKSTILKKEKKFALYLPKGYNSSQKTYPILYLLHGMHGSQSDWIQKGEVQRIADKAINQGKASPMIIVMPDAESSYYMNNANGDYQFEDFFIQEMIPHIEKNYRCKTTKKYRSISGLSMGGFGSLLYSIHHPELFGSCAAMSAAIYTDQEISDMSYKDFIKRYGTPMSKIKEGDERITDFWNQNSILYLIKHIPEKQKKEVRFYIDIGDDDFLYKGNSLLHIAMRDLNIPHNYRVREGSHKWEYWRSGLPFVLEFISEDFLK